MAEKGEGKKNKYQEDVASYPHLHDLVKALNTIDSFPEWLQMFIHEIKSALQYRLREHFESSASTRSQFVSLSPDQWQEKDTNLFNLTETPRPILGYLPKKELERLNTMVRQPCVENIQNNRTTIDDALDQMRASEADRKEVEPVMTNQSSLFEDVKTTREATDFWVDLRDQKTLIIKELVEREEFLDEVEEFETKASGDKERYTKGNSLALAQENKFRAYAAKKMKQIDSKAIQLCRGYKESTGRVFEIDGIDYLEMIKEQKFGRSSNPALSLSKLRPEAISAQDRRKFDAGKPSPVVSPTEEDGKTRRRSLIEEGRNPNRFIRDGPVQPAPITEVVEVVEVVEVAEAAEAS